MPRCKCYAEAEGQPRILVLESASIWDDCKSLERTFPYEEDIKVVCVEA
jgi:hypothetical protein